MITEGELGSAHPTQLSPARLQPSLDPDSDTFITWADSLGQSVGVIPHGQAVSLPLPLRPTKSSTAQSEAKVRYKVSTSFLQGRVE